MWQIFKRATDLRFLIASYDRSKPVRISTNLLPNEGARCGKLYRGAVTRLGIARRYINRKYSPNGTYIVPLGDVKLEPGDELQVSCERGRLKDAKAFFQSN